MITVLVFALLAGLGAVGRGEATGRWNVDGLPWGTLVVNVVGAFLLGLLVDSTPPMVTVLGVGGLGAFTTFSTFANDVLALWSRRRRPAACVYIALTLALGIGAAAAGVGLAS